MKQYYATFGVSNASMIAKIGKPIKFRTKENFKRIFQQFQVYFVLCLPISLFFTVGSFYFDFLIIFATFSFIILPILLTLLGFSPNKIGYFFKKLPAETQDILQKYLEGRHKVIKHSLKTKIFKLRNIDLVGYNFVLKGDFARFYSAIKTVKNHKNWDFYFIFKKVPKKGLLELEY